MKTLIALSALVLAGTTAPAMAAGEENTETKKAKQICKTYKETGSRLGGKRICMTEAQWEEHRQRTKADIDRAQTQQVNRQGT